MELDSRKFVQELLGKGKSYEEITDFINAAQETIQDCIKEHNDEVERETAEWAYNSNFDLLGSLNYKTGRDKNRKGT